MQKDRQESNKKLVQKKAQKFSKQNKRERNDRIFERSRELLEKKREYEWEFKDEVLKRIKDENADN